MQTDLDHQLNLAAELNRLIGDLNCEMAVLPSKNTIGTWYRIDVLYAIIRCKDALIRSRFPGDSIPWKRMEHGKEQTRTEAIPA